MFEITYVVFAVISTMCVLITAYVSIDNHDTIELATFTTFGLMLSLLPFANIAVCLFYGLSFIIQYLKYRKRIRGCDYAGRGN